jgi:hypothetical protein
MKRNDAGFNSIIEARDRSSLTHSTSVRACHKMTEKRLSCACSPLAWLLHLKPAVASRRIARTSRVLPLVGPGTAAHAGSTITDKTYWPSEARTSQVNPERSDPAPRLLPTGTLPVRLCLRESWRVLGALLRDPAPTTAPLRPTSACRCRRLRANSSASSAAGCSRCGEIQRLDATCSAGSRRSGGTLAASARR